MTRNDAKLIQASFGRVVPIQNEAAALFYKRLFEIDPSTAGLFASTDLQRQGSRLMASLGLIVAGLGHPETIVPRAQELARRHVGYGVTESQYASVGAALIWTLEQGLGDAFTQEVRAAWVAAYTLLAGVMIDAARAAA